MSEQTTTPVELPASCLRLQRACESMRTALVAKRKSQVKELISDLEASRERALADSIYVYSRQRADPAILQSYADACTEALALLSQAQILTSDMISR